MYLPPLSVKTKKELEEERSRKEKTEGQSIYKIEIYIEKCTRDVVRVVNGHSFVYKYLPNI